jgi:hypothetical protein
MLILGIDPGMRTGIALISAQTDQPATLLFSEEVSGGLAGFEQWWNDRPDYDILVCEDFIPRQGVHGIVHEPNRIIGFLHPWFPVMQPPAGRKKAVSNDVLKRLGMYLPGEPQRNALEAVRHAVVYLKAHRHIPTLRAGWPD